MQAADYGPPKGQLYRAMKAHNPRKHIEAKRSDQNCPEREAFLNKLMERRKKDAQS